MRLGTELIFTHLDALSNLFNDPLVDAALHQFLGNPNCVHDCLAVRTAMTNETITANAQKRRAAMLLEVVLLV